ncbi:dopey-like leucine zipper transcription factor [Tubulinosema ratisbonensis]|uniref:Dopey-like leucine zipper transcription factor n=1 Tax=Tubulinosema ratisbonensis TaxID=291195 RepID=A0A437ALL0_9MICR|nr:dopey-like leucine zipper transcription factor [Tubulinosema ratisbonensis]
MEEKFKLELKKKLDAFKSAKEWSDFISLLSSLDRTLNSYKPDKIYDLDLLVKRLTQCLSPALPAGVHTKCLETYQIVFNKFSKEYLAEKFDSITFNFFTSASNLKTMALSNYFNILTDNIVPLGKEIEKYSENVLIGLLPFIEIEGNEFFNETLVLLDKFKNSIDKIIFYESLWDIFTVNSHLRISIINYLFKEDHCISDLDRKNKVTLAICSSLQDKQINVLRGSLDILNTFFPIKEINNQSEIIKILSPVLKLFLLRDLSINKRILSWIDLKNEKNFELIYKSMKNILQEELSLFFRIMIILVDNELLFNYLVDKLVLKSLFQIKQGDKKREIEEFYFQKEEKNDYFKYAEIFFENLDRKIFWKSVEKNLIYVLEENFSDGIKGGKKSEKESEIINEEEIEEIDKDIKKIKDKLREQDLIEKEFEKKEQENLILSDDKSIEEENELTIKKSEESLQAKEVSNLSDEKLNESDKDAFSYLKNKEENDKMNEEKFDKNEIKKDFFDTEEEKEIEFNKSNLEEEKEKYISEDMSEDHNKQTFITRSTDEFLELLIFIFDRYKLINDDIKSEFIPNLLIKICQNYQKFEIITLLHFFDKYKMNINNLELSYSFRKLISIEDFLAFCTLLEIFIKHFSFLKDFDENFWQTFYKKFIKLSPTKKQKLIPLFNLILQNEEHKSNILEIFDLKIFFDNFISQIEENSVKYFYNYNFVFEKQLEILFLNYISDLDEQIIEKVNLFFYYLYNYLDISDESFFDVLVCFSYKLENISNFNSKLPENHNFKTQEINETKSLEVKTKIIELFYNIYNNKVIINLIINHLELNRKNNKIKNSRKILGILNVLKCFIKYSTSFCEYLSKESSITSVTLSLLDILLGITVNYDLELKEVNYDITILSLDLINLLYFNGIVARKEIISFDLSKLFEFVVNSKNPFLLIKITTLLEISVNGFKKTEYSALEVVNANLNNIDILFRVIFKMENKISQFGLFSKIVNFRDKENIYLIYKIIKFVVEYNQFYNKDDLESLINTLINNINIIFLSIQKDFLQKEEENDPRFSFFFYYSDKILSILLNKFTKIVIDSVLNTNLMIHKFKIKSKIYDLILKRVLGDNKSLSFLFELNRNLTKDTLKSVILDNKSTIEEIWLLNRKSLDFYHYRFIIDLYLKAKREKEENISKIFNNLLNYIQKSIGYRNREIIKIYDIVIKGYKKINYNPTLFHSILFTLLNEKEKELKEINLEIIYDLSNEINFKQIWDYFLSSDFFYGKIDLKHKLIKNYVKNESARFGELLAKIDQGFFLTKESELQNKYQALKRAAFFMLAGEVNQFMSYFPKILEKLIELINIDPSIRKIFFLLLRVLVVKNNHSKLSNLWPSLFNEIFKFIDIKSNEIFKFMDTLFLINSGETKEFQSKFFVKKNYKKIYYEGIGLITNEPDTFEDDSIFSKLKFKNDLKEIKDFIPIPPKRKSFLPVKKNLKENDIKEYLTYVCYYYKHLDEYSIEIDDENFLQSILVEFDEE